jgi:Phage gp6-like head-tail connector protein
MSNEFVQNLAVLTPPAEEPISLVTAKLHLRVTITAYDDLITALITAARELVEKEVRRALVTRTYQLRMNRFPFWAPAFAWNPLVFERLPMGIYGHIHVPKPPLIAVNSIQYLDVNGTLQTLDPSQYLVDAGGILQGAITPSYGNYFPQTRYQLDAVLISYDAGYGAASAVPTSLCQAMLLLVGHWYRNTEAATETSFSELTLGAKALCSSFKWGSYG